LSQLSPTTHLVKSKSNQSIGAYSNYFSNFEFKLLHKIKSKHKSKHILKSHPAYQRYYSLRQSPRVHWCLKKSLNFFFFLHFSFLFFANIYGPQKNLQNYTSSAVGDGDRDLPSCPTAVGGARYCSAFLPTWATAVGFSLFSNICHFLFELGWR
jgi:hypothetical protein